MSSRTNDLAPWLPEPYCDPVIDTSMKKRHKSETARIFTTQLGNGSNLQKLVPQNTEMWGVWSAEDARLGC